MKIILMLFLMSMLNGCNIDLFVNKDNVIRHMDGYLYIAPNNHYIDFIPSFIDTTISIDENLKMNGLGVGFYLYNLRFEELKYIKIFADTLSKGEYLIPVTLQYYEEFNYYKTTKIHNEHYFKVNKSIHKYKVIQRRIHPISIYPKLSKSVEIMKTKGYKE